MQKDFQKLVKLLKKKYKLFQRDIAYELDVSENTISRCLNGHQGNTGDKFVSDLERLIEACELERSGIKQVKQNSTPTHNNYNSQNKNVQTHKIKNTQPKQVKNTQSQYENI